MAINKHNVLLDVPDRPIVFRFIVLQPYYRNEPNKDVVFPNTNLMANSHYDNPGPVETIKLSENLS